MYSYTYVGAHRKACNLDVLKEKGMFHINFADRENAEITLKRAKDFIELYGNMAVSDLYDLIIDTYGIVKCPPEDHHLGWTSMEGVEITKIGEVIYSLSFPMPHPLSGLETTATDDKMVSHPPHYQSETGLEAIDVIEAFTFDLKGIEATDTGNVLKYMCRWKSKNGLQDLKKAKWYLEHLINHVEKLEKEND